MFQESNSSIESTVLPSSLAALAKALEGEIVVNGQGQGFYSRRAIARLVGCSPAIIIEATQTGGHEKRPKLAEMLAAKGFTPGHESEMIADRFLPVFVRYFCDVARGDFQQAKMLRELLSELGSRTLTHQLTGWQPQQQSKGEMAFEMLVEYARNWVSLEKNTSDMPGLQQLNNSLTSGVKALPASEQDGYLSIKEWLVRLGYQPSHGLITETGRQVKAIYVQLKQQQPRKAIRTLTKRCPTTGEVLSRSVSRVAVYHESDANLIELALEKTQHLQ